ncbi:MAG: cache domain-containing protein [Rhodospirillum sp.]|nr:cache domain-containing protein [Rhodospirillum sp.]MCF8488235.1 cache domain-containing protein [Rhodospirillum sp.]MCF8501243.1 cache domain-containing protein [Rhodospirillum sp.]
MDRFGTEGGGRRSLIGTLTMAMSGVAVALIALFSVLWLTIRVVGFTEETRNIRESLLSEKKLYLRVLVDEAVAYVDFATDRAAEDMRQELRDRVDRAHAQVAHLVATQGVGKSREELENLVRETLRPLRYDGGRGYFFAVDMTGIAQLNAINPAMEGRDVSHLTGAKGESVVPDMIELVQLDGAGFQGYSWNRPNLPLDDRIHEKISYVRHFEPLDWIVGTGEYMSDLRASVKERVIERLASMRSADGSYVFVGDWTGVSLAGPARGRNMINATDLDGVKVVQSLIKQARVGSGFLTYRMPGVGDHPTARKMSYVRGIPEWEWYVGAGLYVDDLDALVTQRKEYLFRTLMTELAMGAAAILFAAGLILVIHRRVATRLRASHDRFTSFLTQAAHGKGRLDPNALAFDEYRDLADFTNTLVEARSEAEHRLAERGDELERSNRDLERFAFVASHDLQEPLRNINGFIQLIDRRLGDLLDGESREFFGYVQDNVRRMRAQILGLLEYSRLDRMPLNREVTSLDRLVSATIREMGAVIEEKGADVIVGDLPAMAVDIHQTRILFHHLIDNALTFGVEGRPNRIEISARREGDDRWWMEVSDRGRGIDEANREKIFEIFKRIDGSAGGAGAGLGLSICRRIVERHGGEIFVESTKGEGVRIRFTLTASFRGQRLWDGR